MSKPIRTPIKWKDDKPKISFQKRALTSQLASKAEGGEEEDTFRFVGEGEEGITLLPQPTSHTRKISFFNFFRPIDMRTLEIEEGHTAVSKH